jgi:uncharacterized protein (DUF302 family)
MKNIFLSTCALALTMLLSGCGQQASTPKTSPVAKQESSAPVAKMAHTNAKKTTEAKDKNVQTIPDIRIITTSNVDGKITPKTIEAAFKKYGFEISANNDMSKSFEGKFGKTDKTAGTDFLIYRLMPVLHRELSVNLVKEYPEFGLIAPISTSVYSKDGKEISISSLSLNAMSRMTGVPESNADLVKLYSELTKALKEALPGGTFEDLRYNILRPDGSLVTRFAFVLPNESGDIIEALENYEEQMEGEVESVGFVFPVFTDMTEDLQDSGYDEYEFYKTVSICNLDVIYPVHKNHPEVGAYAPCTMYKYKKKSDKFTRMGYPSVHNWTIGTQIEDEYSLDPLIEAQDLLESKIDSTIE